VRGYSGQVQLPGAVLDKDQHVQPLEQHGLDHQEIAGDDRMGLSGQELPPGRPDPAGRRIEPAACRISHTVEAATW
jgi:hypothetical protein